MIALFLEAETLGGVRGALNRALNRNGLLPYTILTYSKIRLKLANYRKEVGSKLAVKVLRSS